MNSGYQTTGFVDNCVTNRRKRCKSDWAGIGPGDVNNPNIDYYQRAEAQRQFYRACRNAQYAAAEAAGINIHTGYKTRVQPQLGPCYTTYPALVAAYAAIGLTAFLEFRGIADCQGAEDYRERYLEWIKAGKCAVNKVKEFRHFAEVVSLSVHTRILLEDLSRKEGLPCVEVYRLFLASQQSLNFDSLPEILNAGIVLGDVLPDLQDLQLHPVTLKIFRDIDCVSADYKFNLPAVPSHELSTFASMWISDLCSILSKYLQNSGEKPPDPKPDVNARPERGRTDECGGLGDFSNTMPASKKDRIAPLNGPKPPMLISPPSAAERALASLMEGKSAGSNEAGEKSPPCDQAQAQVKEILQDFSRTMDSASGQHRDWEDMRSDLVEQAMKEKGFSCSPIEGSPADGHEVAMRIGGFEMKAAEVFDQPVELSNDISACRELLDASKPVADTLSRTLYPNVEERVEKERFCTQGGLDPSRLALAGFTANIFNRYRVRESEDKNGAPLLMIACDASGSLDCSQMRMLKLLSAAWMQATAKSRIQLMAGIYHSGRIRMGVSGTLVQWIYHPRKTMSVSRIDAVRAIASLPDSGTGCQLDAVSLQFMFDEAIALARGKKIYLVVISDCQWNSSFGDRFSPVKEVSSFFENAYIVTAGNLHVTLVALGVKAETGFENLLDRVITVSPDELDDVSRVAQQIGVYVASCMKERRSLAVR